MKKEIKNSIKSNQDALDKYVIKLSGAFVALRTAAEDRYWKFENIKTIKEGSKIKAIPFAKYLELVKVSMNFQKKILRTKDELFIGYLLSIQNILIIALSYISTDKMDCNFLEKFRVIHFALKKNNKALYDLQGIKYAENFYN